jgi:hypothetical protein
MGLRLKAMTAKLHYFALLLFFTGGFFSYYDKKIKEVD